MPRLPAQTRKPPPISKLSLARRKLGWARTLIPTIAAQLAMLRMDIDISPNDSGLPGIAQLKTSVGAIMTVGLILSVLALIISAIIWGFGSNSSNPHMASRGKSGVIVSCAVAVICGASVTLINRTGRA